MSFVILVVFALLGPSLCQQPVYYLPSSPWLPNGFAWAEGIHSYPEPDTEPTTTKWTYAREANASLEFVKPLADFTRIRFYLSTEWIASEIQITITDEDGDRFAFLVDLPTPNPDAYVEVDLTPADFAPLAPIVKPTLDPSLLHRGFRLLDTNSVSMNDGAWNLVRITSVIVDYADFDTVLTSLVVGEGEVYTLDSRSVAVVGGPIEVRGQLVLTSVSRFYLLADMLVTGAGSAFSVTNTLVVSPQTYNYERNIELQHGASVNVLRSTWAVFQPIGMGLFNGSSFVGTDMYVTAPGLVTMGLQNSYPEWNIPGNSLSLSRVHGFGEIIVNEGSTVTADFCTGFLLFWHWLPPTNVGTLVFPPPDSLLDYSSPPSLPYTIDVTNGIDTMYAVIASARSHAVIDRSTLRVIGMYFESELSLEGIRNGETYADQLFQYGEMNLRLTETYVQTFNFYAARYVPENPISHLQMRNCLFGEALPMGSSEITIRDSTCDGSGGYLGSRDESELTAWYSEINARVIAHDTTVLRLYGCTVNGDVIAEGTIYINGTTVNGQVTERPPNGRVIYGELIDPDVVDAARRRTIAIVVGSVLGSLFVLLLPIIIALVVVVVVCIKKKNNTSAGPGGGVTESQMTERF